MAISLDRHGFDAWLPMLGADGSVAIRRAGGNERKSLLGLGIITHRSGPECNGRKQTGGSSCLRLWILYESIRV